MIKKTPAWILAALACFGFTNMILASSRNDATGIGMKHHLAELTIDIKQPFTKETNPERIGVHFVLTNKSKEDLIFAHMFGATVSMYVVNDSGRKTRIWLPPEKSYSGSVVTETLKPGESKSFINPMQLDVLKEAEGKSLIASVLITPPGATEDTEVFSEIFKIPPLPAKISDTVN